MIDTICSRFEEFRFPEAPDGTNGPLGWPGYDERREQAREKTGEAESVVCGVGTIGEQRAVFIVSEFGFLGGSIGSETGARIVGSFERARELRVPVVSLVASGGSRLQEGICALRQLQEITRAAVLARREGIPHVAVARHPTTGGMWASLSAGADFVLALPEATISFGGSRVRDADEIGPAFTAEGTFEAGQVDRVVAPSELPQVLTSLVHVMSLALATRPDPAEVPESPTVRELPESGGAATRRARAEDRPRARAYLDRYLEHRVELSGDRCGGTDAGMLCGIGERRGRAIAFAAQTGTATTPAGFRTAKRLITLAERLAIPVLTLVDTPGAANDAAAERAGVGPAIAELFAAVAEATVPITTLVVGEGGSGGALALAAPERTWITVDGYFAVIAPEAATAILKQDQSEVDTVADRLWLRPQDLLELGFVRGIVGTP